MGQEKDRHRRLADYIYNDLSMDDVVEMEREISSDPQMSDSYQLNVQVKDYLQAKLQLEEMRSDPQLEDAELLADLAFDTEPLKPVVREPQPGMPGKNRTRRLTIVTALAASIALIIAFGIVPSNLNEDRLFDRYYETFAASDYNQRGITEEIYKEVAIGINHYRDGNYQECIEHFSKLGSDPSIDTEVQLYSALSFLGLGQYTPAQELFESLSSKESRYQAEALWYHSLSSLKTGDYDKADELLEQLVKYDGKYKKDSQTLRKKLRRLIP